MGIEFNVTKEFIVNGKKYNSLEEVPAEIRQALGKTLGGADAGAQIQADMKIIFNGKEYASIDAMPQGERALYNEIMKAVASGKAPQGLVGALGADRFSNARPSPDRPRPIEPELSVTLSQGKLLAAVIVLLLVLGVYFLTRG